MLPLSYFSASRAARPMTGQHTVGENGRCSSEADAAQNRSYDTFATYHLAARVVAAHIHTFPQSQSA